MRIVIEGRNPPGRQFEQHANVHVALQERRDPLGLVPGDAPSARWALDVAVVGTAGDRDFRGPAVQGKRGERFVYLTWGDVASDGRFVMFRRAKLMLADVDASLLEAAQHDGRTLVATVDLSDERGGPRCARVRPPAIAWSLHDRSGAGG